MNTKQFQYMLVLAREGSFSRAAEVLNITQPSLSQYIKKIEKEIGMELFDRTNGEVRLTKAGQVYLDAGRKILDIELQMENAFSDLAGNKAGSLIIGAAPYRTAGMLPEIAAKFKKVYPGICLIVREGTTAELSEGMEHGEYDLAITLLPVEARLFQWDKVMEEELVLAVPREYPDFRGEQLFGRKYPAIEASELDGKSMVMLTETQYMQRQLDNLLAEYKIHVQTAAVVKSLGAQIEMVKAGIGVALMPSGIERFCSKGDVRFYSLKQNLPKREVVLMWRREQKLSTVAESLKKIILSIDWG